MNQRIRLSVVFLYKQIRILPTYFWQFRIIPMPCGELVSGTKKFIAQNKKRNVQLLYNGIQTIGGTSEPYDFTEEAVTPLGHWERNQRYTVFVSVMKGERPLLGCRGFLSCQGFDLVHIYDCVDLVSVHPFYLPSPRSCFFLPSRS